MLKPSTIRPSRTAMVRKERSTSGRSSSTNTVSTGAEPSLESAHSRRGRPLTKTTIIGGILPAHRRAELPGEGRHAGHAAERAVEPVEDRQPRRFVVVLGRREDVVAHRPAGRPALEGPEGHARPLRPLGHPGEAAVGRPRLGGPHRLPGMARGDGGDSGEERQKTGESHRLFPAGKREWQA